MSYLVLARKYRPANFTELVGQEHVVQALTNALTSQRLHHAYLFTGTRGVGKTTISRILAKSLNCQGADGKGGITAQPCGVCQTCKDIDQGCFVDYTELDAASNRGVGEVQTLLEQAVYKPVQGRFKVFMIDEVHMLTNHAFNAMLKTLEEPPDYLKFVLATTDPQKVPVTVLSRCLQFNLRPIAPDTVATHLQAVLQQENITHDVGAVRLLSRSARGSMRDALSLTDQAIAFGAGELKESSVRLMLGSVDRSHVFRLIAALAGFDGKAVVEIVDTLRLNGLSAAATLEEMASVLQRMAVYQMVAAATLDATDSDAVEINRLAALLPADETQLLYSMCLHGRGELGLAPDEYAALTMVLLRLLAFKLPPDKTIAQLSPPPVAGTPTAAPSAEDSPKWVARDNEVVTAKAPIEKVSPAPLTTTPMQAAIVKAPAPQIPEQIMVEVSENLQIKSDSAVDAQENFNAPSAEPASPVETKSPISIVNQPPAVVVTSVPAVAVVDAQALNLADLWHATVQSLIENQLVTALTRELALQSQLVQQDENGWVLRVEQASLAQAAICERLKTALNQANSQGNNDAVHLNLQVNLGPVTDTPAQRNAIAANKRLRAAEELVHNDPFVQEMMRNFGATIVPGSIQAPAF